MPPMQLKLKVHSLRAFSKTANVKSPATTTSFTPTSRTRSGSVGPMDSRRFGMSTACGGCGRSSVATCGCSGAGYVVQPLRWSGAPLSANTTQRRTQSLPPQRNPYSMSRFLQEPTSISARISLGGKPPGSGSHRSSSQGMADLDKMFARSAV